MSESEDRSRTIEELRRELGTLPKQLGNEATRYYRGGEGVKVILVSPRPFPNLYAAMYVMAVQTWGGIHDSGVRKWNDASPEIRMKAIRAILQRQALPLALEHPQFLFEISGCSRSSFDQIARARIGVTFSSMGTRDNAHGDFSVVVPPHVYDDKAMLEVYTHAIEDAKRAYISLLRQGRSWQDARAVLPQSMTHRFCMSANYAALSTFMSKRLMFCEQYDTVTVAWKMREALAQHYAVLATTLLPACDFAKKCVYHQQNLSEMFGCLFKGCGRWDDPYPLHDFNESSTNPEDVGPLLRRYEQQVYGAKPINWDKAFEQDAHWFEEKLII
jgi:thymidylate synthase ThyX